MALGGFNTFAWLSFAISQTPKPANDWRVLVDSGLFGAAGLLGMSLFAAALGLVRRQPWGVRLGLAGQGGLLAAGLVLAAKSAPVGVGTACGGAAIGLWYLTKPEFSAWKAEAQSPVTPRMVVWLRTSLLVAAYVQLGALLASPIGFLYAGGHLRPVGATAGCRHSCAYGPVAGIPLRPGAVVPEGQRRARRRGYGWPLPGQCPRPRGAPALDRLASASPLALAQNVVGSLGE